MWALPLEVILAESPNKLLSLEVQILDSTLGCPYLCSIVPRDNQEPR